MKTNLLFAHCKQPSTNTLNFNFKWINVDIWRQIFLFAGFFDRREFIVSQHPLENTMTSFWRMIWEQEASLVVVLSSIDSQVKIFVTIKNAKSRGGGPRGSSNFWKKPQGARGYAILCFIAFLLPRFLLIRPGWALYNNPLPPTLSSFLNFGTKWTLNFLSLNVTNLKLISKHFFISICKCNSISISGVSPVLADCGWSESCVWSTNPNHSHRRNGHIMQESNPAIDWGLFTLKNFVFSKISLLSHLFLDQDTKFLF